MKIEIIETDEYYYTAIVDSRFADMLTKDEALAVVASALFSDRISFVKTYEQWATWQYKYVSPVSEIMSDYPSCSCWVSQTSSTLL